MVGDDGQTVRLHQNLVWHVRLLEATGVLVGQRHVEGADGLFELFGLADADDRRRHARLPKEPGERDCAGRTPLRGGDRADAARRRRSRRRV